MTRHLFAALLLVATTTGAAQARSEAIDPREGSKSWTFCRALNIHPYCNNVIKFTRRLW